MKQHFLITSLASSVYQVEKVFEGLTEDQINIKITDQAMSALEHAEHLCEVYHAFMVEADGGKYEWGQAYSSGCNTLSEKLELILSSHGKAVDLTESNPDGVGATVCDYIISHNSYHVGQMCLLRMKLDSAWNPYCIYNH